MKYYKRLRLSVPYSSHPLCSSYFFVSFFYISPVTTFYTLYSPRSVIPLKESKSNVYMLSAFIACASITISHAFLPKSINSFCNLWITFASFHKFVYRTLFRKILAKHPCITMNVIYIPDDSGSIVSIQFCDNFITNV